MSFVLRTEDGGFLEMQFAANGSSTIAVQPIDTLSADTSCMKYWRTVAVANPPEWWRGGRWNSSSVPQPFALQFVSTGLYLDLQLTKNLVPGLGIFNGAPSFVAKPEDATLWCFPADVIAMFAAGAINGLSANPTNTDLAKLNAKTPIAMYQVNPGKTTEYPNFAILGRNVTFTKPTTSVNKLPATPQDVPPTTEIFLPVPQLGHGCGHPVHDTGHKDEHGNPVLISITRPGQPADCPCTSVFDQTNQIYYANYGTGSPCDGGFAFGIFNPAIPKGGSGSSQLETRPATVVPAQSTFYLADAPDIQCVLKPGQPTAGGAGATGHQQAPNYTDTIAIVICAVGGVLLLAIIVLIALIVRASRKATKTAALTDKATGGAPTTYGGAPVAVQGGT